MQRDVERVAENVACHDVGDRALRQGAADYLLKPINPDALRATLHRVAERRQLELAKERSDAAFRSLVDAAPCIETRACRSSTRSNHKTEDGCDVDATAIFFLSSEWLALNHLQFPRPPKRHLALLYVAKTQSYRH